MLQAPSVSGLLARTPPRKGDRASAALKGVLHLTLCHPCSVAYANDALMEAACTSMDVFLNYRSKQSWINGIGGHRFDCDDKDTPLDKSCCLRTVSARSMSDELQHARLHRDP